MTGTHQEWTVQKLLNWTTEHFTAKEFPSARLEAELLLAHGLGKRRLDLYLQFDKPVSKDELGILREMIKRRLHHEPIAYILGRQEFYGRTFSVGPGVLVPRPETEHLIDRAIQWFKDKKGENSIEILDVASGTGCIGVTLAAELPMAQVTAIDVSDFAYRYTMINAQGLGVADRVEAIHGNFDSWSIPTDSFDLVTSNPPYIAEKEVDHLMRDVREFEPRQALVGGELGSETIVRWIPKMAGGLKVGGLLLCEIGYDQEEIVKKLSMKSGLLGNIEVLRDYSGHPRIVCAVKTAAI